MNELYSAIKEASSVVIALPDRASDKDYLAALQLRRIDAQKVHIMAPEGKENKWQTALDIEPEEREFTITIDTAKSPVEELRYEKNDENIVVYLTHRHKFDPTAISFEERFPPADLFITLGFGNHADAESFIEPLPKNGAARHIFIGEPEKQENKKITFKMAGLLGRIMARSRKEDALDTLWTFITRDDFGRTDTKPEDMPSLIKSYSVMATLPRISVVLWQTHDDDGTYGIVWSEDAEFIKRFSSMIGAAITENSYCPLPKYTNFIDAETEVRKLLREVA